MRRPGFKRILATAACAGVLLTPQAAATARRLTVEYVRCWPVSSCGRTLTVPIGSWVLIKTDSLPPVPQVRFSGGVTADARRMRGNRLIVKVPDRARPGPMRVKARGTAWSRTFGYLHPQAAQAIMPPAPSGSAFDGNGMWIWQLPNTERGNLGAIIAKAKAHDVTTVFVKSGDGNHNWAQFTPALVSAFHAGGLQVCAWPYVYGKEWSAEATQTIRSIRMGADCLAIDAETEYEGRYAQALKYITAVRKAVGGSYPISLAGYPYVDYHLRFPYSVFFGPGGVQYNQPQVYWRDIGGGVDRVMAHTWRTNLPYGRRIVPIGQLWQGPRAAEVSRFRALAAVWGAPGVSWWDWQEAPARLWNPLGAKMNWPPSRLTVPASISIGKGSRGDLALWAQMHLKAAGSAIAADGNYGTATKSALAAFQARHGLPATGTVDGRTWIALLRVPLPKPVWAASIESMSRAHAPLPASRQMEFHVRPHH